MDEWKHSVLYAGFHHRDEELKTWLWEVHNTQDIDSTVIEDSNMIYLERNVLGRPGKNEPFLLYNWIETVADWWH